MLERGLPACTSGAEWCSQRALSQNMVSRALLAVEWGIYCIYSCMHPLLRASQPLLTSEWPSNHIVAPRLLSGCFHALSLADAAAGGDHHAQHR